MFLRWTKWPVQQSTNNDTDVLKHCVVRRARFLSEYILAIGRPRLSALVSCFWIPVSAVGEHPRRGARTGTSAMPQNSSPAPLASDSQIAGTFFYILHVRTYKLLRSTPTSSYSTWYYSSCSSTVQYTDNLFDNARALEYRVLEYIVL
jgi:hypothetical protein